MEKVGRPLDRMLLLDTSPDPLNKNLLRVEPWTGSQGDAQLAEICPLLAMIALRQLSVPDVLRQVR